MKPRTTILGLMGVVLIVAIGAAGLKQAPRLITSIAYTATASLFLYSAVRAGRGRRTFPHGFAVFGGAHLLLTFGVEGQSTSAPSLSTVYLVEFACVYLQRLSPASLDIESLNKVGLCLMSVIVGLVGGLLTANKHVSGGGRT